MSSKFDNKTVSEQRLQQLATVMLQSKKDGDVSVFGVVPRVSDTCVENQSSVADKNTEQASAVSLVASHHRILLTVSDTAAVRAQQ